MQKEVTFKQMVTISKVRKLEAPRTEVKKVYLNYVEARILTDAGKLVFQKTIETETSLRTVYFIEVPLEALASIAL